MKPRKSIRIDSTLRGKVKLGTLIFEGLNCQVRNQSLWQALQSLAEKYHREYSEPSQAAVLLRPARDLYRSIGIEPTKTRPSSEALLRRVIQGKPLYQINSIVDVCNLCSLQFLLPIGLYDWQKIEGAVLLRKGQEGERYRGIGKELIQVTNRFVLADALGAFGSPTADSLRTAVQSETRNVLFVIFAPFNYSESAFSDNMNFSESMMLKYHQGKIICKKIIR